VACSHLRIAPAWCGIIARLSTDALAARGFPALMPSIVRWTVRPGTEAAESRVLLAPGFRAPCRELPKVNGQRHAVAFRARIHDAEGELRGALVRFELECGEHTFEQPGFVFGEPTLVARPARARRMTASCSP